MIDFVFRKNLHMAHWIFLGAVCHAGGAFVDLCAAVTQDLCVYNNLISYLQYVRQQNKNAWGLMYK